MLGQENSGDQVALSGGFTPKGKAFAAQFFQTANRTLRADHDHGLVQCIALGIESPHERDDAILRVGLELCTRPDGGEVDCALAQVVCDQMGFGGKAQLESEAGGFFQVSQEGQVLPCVFLRCRVNSEAEYPHILFSPTRCGYLQFRLRSGSR